MDDNVARKRVSHWPFHCSFTSKIIPERYFNFNYACVGTSHDCAVDNYLPPSRRTVFSAVEELDPTLAVVLGRPRLGKYKISAARIAVCSKRQFAKESSDNNQISAKDRTARYFSS